MSLRTAADFRDARNEQIRSARNMRADGRSPAYVGQAVAFARDLNHAAIRAARKARAS